MSEGENAPGFSEHLPRTGILCGLIGLFDRELVANELEVSENNKVARTTATLKTMFPAMEARNPDPPNRNQDHMESSPSDGASRSFTGAAIEIKITWNQVSLQIAAFLLIQDYQEHLKRYIERGERGEERGGRGEREMRDEVTYVEFEIESRSNVKGRGQICKKRHTSS